MIVPTLLSWFIIMASAAPTGPSVHPSVIIQGEATQGTDQNPDYHTPAPPSSQVQQPALSLQPDPRGGFHLISEQFLWSPVGGAPTFVLLQQPISSPRSFIPLISPAFINQLDSTLSSFSSEEFEVNIYLSTALTDPSAATVQPVKQAAGLQNLVSTVGTPSTGAPQNQVPTSSGPPMDTNGVPVGSEKPAEEMATVQHPVEAELLPLTQTRSV
ncbi:secretory calcium-binding phosphoprotein 4 precursor [Takifugu rubripes]|uniref:SCPP4 n=1 Tax=Takifugu rubripes TaxID=31033 RepID=Q2Y0W2_TAKRU|nr:secretory calcium-binding phosphoprotein 4 precursor [Takifugu rubripes]AAZ22387.1 SCPP4 [Takifugu rubripes]|eukprot:NP_001032945.1 secretory calcium-binding phosphoprotein 4 precursor [Takifugu rubripes]